MRRLRLLSPVIISLVLLTAACGSDKNDSSTAATTTSTTPALSGEITVLAAASLTNGFTELGAEFSATYPGVKAAFSFGSSAELATQIEQGAPADVYASADQANMDKIVAARANAGDPIDFAKNKLQIAVEKGNPKQIAKLADLTASGTVVVLCDSSVPCGKFADEVLGNAGVTLAPSSRETNVKATLSRVELGEADAAIVYASDVASSGKVDGVEIPDDVNVVTTLPVVALKDSQNAAVAQAWVDFVVANADELISKFGFQAL